jgi:hypothetical protein
MKLSRSLLALALIGLVSTCAEPTGNNGTAGFAGLVVRVPAPPAFSLRAPGLVLDLVKIVVGKDHPQQEFFEALDSTTVRFTDTRNSARAQLQLLLGRIDTLRVVVTYFAEDGTQLFVANGDVIVTPGVVTSTPPLQPFYVGPGFNIANLFLTPADSILSAGDSLTLDPQATDANQQPVTQFYVTWSTDDTRVPITPRGRIGAPAGLTRRVTVTATTPSGLAASTTVSVLGTSALGITPDSIEKLPGSTQLFRVTVGALRTSQFVWSVNGVDGGDATNGTINVDGTYTAPATVPTPNKVKVCARDAASPTLRDGCATVVINAVPSVGADLIVINDQNIFDFFAMSPDSAAQNRRFVRNLIGFSGTGPRASGKGVWYDRGRNSPCLANGECGDSSQINLDAVITGAGYTITKLDFQTPLVSIPSNVKVMFLWMPLVSYDMNEINVLKRFAAEGGRIVFIGERVVFYTQAGIDLENNFLSLMGSQMVNLANEFDCGAYFGTTATTQRSNPLLAGVNRLLYACAAEIQAGPNDAPLFFDTTNTHLLAAVTKVDVTPLAPLPAPPVAIRATAPPGRNGIGRH